MDRVLWTPASGLPDGARARDWLREQRRQDRARWGHIRDPRIEQTYQWQAAARIGGVVSAQASAATITTGGLTSTPSVGDLIVIIAASYGVKSGGSDYTTNTPTDSQSNSYVICGSVESTSPSSNAHIHVGIWYSVLTAAGASMTFTATTTGTTASPGTTIAAIHMTGMSATPYNGDMHGAVGSSATPASGTTSPAPAANSIFVGALAPNSGTITDGSGWNALDPTTPGLTSGMVTALRQTGAGPPQSLYGELMLASTAQSATWSMTSRVWAAACASFAPAATAAGELFLVETDYNGLGVGGPFFGNPIG